MGTDTVASLIAARRYYHEPMAGFSIPAAEHSTMTSWGQAHEKDAYENMLRRFAGQGKLVAVVSDSYDLWHAIDQIWGESLKEQVQQSGGTLVIRPDSGDPVTVVCTAINKLMNAFGFSLNSKGYKVLPDYIRIIQGDGVSPGSIERILEAMKHQKLSAENVAFGMGSSLLQRLNRDSLKFAMKTSAVAVDGVWHDVFKDPQTDRGKASKKGRLALARGEQGFTTLREQALKSHNVLRPVYRSGKLLIDETLAAVRARAALAADLAPENHLDEEV
jgi:nicotinamide phosphoribosyltransferase